MSLPAFLLVLHLIPESEKLAELGIRLALTMGGAFLLMQLAWLLVGRVRHWMVRAGHDRPGSVQRAQTVAQTLRSLATAVIWAGAFVHALAIFGWDVKPLLAGAGILGVALGFGAQTLVRDLIAGYFILIENQLAHGELVEVDGQPALYAAAQLWRLRSLRAEWRVQDGHEPQPRLEPAHRGRARGRQRGPRAGAAAVPRGRGRIERRAGLA
jgi:small-conductance mechanosensitive channel